MKDLGTLGGLHSEARAINDAGLVVGQAMRPDNKWCAFLYDGKGMQDLGTGPEAWAINSSGQIVGRGPLRSEPGVPARRFGPAVLYQNGMMRDLSLPDWKDSTARGINSVGHIVGYARRSGDVVGGALQVRAFLHEDGKTFDLNDLIEPNSGWVLEYAYGINDRGQIVGAGAFQKKVRAFLLTPRPKRPD
jgi:probable HAF family extracellular repeat protein